MLFTGVLKKMRTELNDEVQYYMEFPDSFLHANDLINHKLNMQFKGYQCLSCGKDKPIFRQGFCKSCFFESPMAGEWIMKPELSTAHLNREDRDLKFEKAVQLQPHIVYLAVSSHVKVGVTRKTQVPTRWIDQGAHKAIPLLEVPNRYLAGVAEVALKQHLSDKTNWRKMLTNTIKDIDLYKIREKVRPYIPEEVIPYLIEHPQKTEIHFPVEAYPKKVKSFSFRKKQNFSGTLKGIKGQYFIFDDDHVINIRGNSGYVIDLDIE